MVWKASKTKILKEKSILLLIGLGSIFSILIPLSTLIFEKGKLVNICLDSCTEKKSTTFTLGIYIIFSILIFGVGLFCDIQMYNFTKETDETNNHNSTIANLVPWHRKSSQSSQGGVDEKDTEIPLRATIISSVHYFVTLTLLPIGELMIHFNLYWIYLMIIIITAVTPFPLLLIFTIKRKKENQANHKKNQIQPPSKLQFHENYPNQSMSHPLQYHDEIMTKTISPIEFSFNPSASKQIFKINHSDGEFLQELNCATLQTRNWVCQSSKPVVIHSKHVEPLPEIEC